MRRPIALAVVCALAMGLGACAASTANGSPRFTGVYGGIQGGTAAGR